MAKIHIKSEKLTPFGGIFSGQGAIGLHIVICNRLDLAYCLKSHHGVREFHLLRLHHKDSLRKRVFLERYPQP